MNLLTGKRALVCGSSQGIGKAIACCFADQGAQLVLVARNEESLVAVCEQLSTRFNQKHTFFVADFLYPDRLKTILRNQLSDRQPFHILVNNTGGPPGGLIHTAETDEFMDALSQHLLCNQVLVQAVLDGMMNLKFGRIINIISTSVKQPIPGLGVSNTVRGAVANWSKTLAAELAPVGITVNNILPGATETARLASIINTKAEQMNQSAEIVAEELRNAIPMKRFARPEEIANVAGFLASDLASYVTGINLPVDGGRTESL